MSRQVTSAVFDTQAQAETAVTHLRSAGVGDRDISLIAQHGGDTEVHDGRGDTVSEGGHGVSKGLTLGASVGALAGIAALVIPGVGPFIAAGALTSTLGVAGASVATGAVAGAATGGLAGALANYGVSHDDSRYYEDRMSNGGVVVTVDLTSAGMNETTASDILYNAGGHSSTRTSGMSSTSGMSNTSAMSNTSGMSSGSTMGTTSTTSTTTY